MCTHAYYLLITDGLDHHLLASERSERDTYRGNTIKNRGCLFICIYVTVLGKRDHLRKIKNVQ